MTTDGSNQQDQESTADPGQVVVGSGVAATRDAHLAGDHVAGRDINIQQLKTGDAALAVPYQLPPLIRDFTGREAELAEVIGLLKDNDKAPAVVISAIAGKAGVGKTTLVVRVAHELRSHFPDGQLYVNLRGVEAQVLDPADVLAGFLRAFGFAGDAIPESLEERAQLYRGRLADRRVLVVLDNAAEEPQVRPLLPGSPGCAVLITSRSQLAGLESAHRIVLDVLEEDQALGLLGKVAQPERVIAEADAARQIVRLCGYLPLAVRIAGAKLDSRRHWRLAKLADGLSDERERLGQLAIGDLEVRASFALSYQARGSNEQQAFRLLGILRTPDFSSWAVAAFLDLEPKNAEALVEKLVDAQLLEAAGEDATGKDRYKFHDLLRVFARERLREEESDTARRDALQRFLRYYLAEAERYDALLPGELHKSSRDRSEGPSPDPNQRRAEEKRALRWFGAERVGLVTAVEQAHDEQLWELAWRIASTLPDFFEFRGHWNDWCHTHELALSAARRLGDRQAEALVLRNLGIAYWRQGRFNEAEGRFLQCRPIFRELDDRHGEAATLRGLGRLYRDWHRTDAAIACYSECLPMFRDLGDRHGEAYAIRGLADVYRDLDRSEDSLRCFHQCLATFRELDDWRWESGALRSLGDFYRHTEQWDDALACYEKCLAVFREFGSRWWEAATLRGLGEVHLRKGHLKNAIECLRESLQIFEQLGHRLWEAKALSSLGRALAASGDPQRAERAQQRANVLFEQFVSNGAQQDPELPPAPPAVAQGSSDP